MGTQRDAELHHLQTSVQTEATGSEQDAFDPPPVPAHVHVHGPMPATKDATPDAHRPVLGAVCAGFPLALPHAPLTAVGPDLLAEQDAVAPPLVPAHVQVHGPVPETGEAAPTMQRFAVGAELIGLPFALPHTPFVANVPPVPG